MLTVGRLARLALATTVAAGCRLDDPNAVEASQALGLEISVDSALADGSSRIPFTLALVRETPPLTEVTLRTDLGAFAGEGGGATRELKVKPASARSSFVVVTGIVPGVLTVSASAGGFVVLDTVALVPALPETLELSSDVTKARADGQTAVNLVARTFRRELGHSVSLGSRVRFDVSMGGRVDPELSTTGETDGVGVVKRSVLARLPGTYTIVARAGAVADTVTVEFTP